MPRHDHRAHVSDQQSGHEQRRKHKAGGNRGDPVRSPPPPRPHATTARIRPRHGRASRCRATRTPDNRAPNTTDTHARAPRTARAQAEAVEIRTRATSISGAHGQTAEAIETRARATNISDAHGQTVEGAESTRAVGRAHVWTAKAAGGLGWVAWDGSACGRTADTLGCRARAAEAVETRVGVSGAIAWVWVGGCDSGRAGLSGHWGSPGSRTATASAWRWSGRRGVPDVTVAIT